jgi:hypothetical protein
VGFNQYSPSRKEGEMENAERGHTVLVDVKGKTAKGKTAKRKTQKAKRNKRFKKDDSDSDTQ